jgi:MFS family permease
MAVPEEVREQEQAKVRERGLFNLNWYRSLDDRGRPAFWASFAGWALDAFDYQALPLALAAITATFALSDGQAGLIATVTLVMSAVGGVLAGTLADRIGRVRTLMLTVGVFSVFTLLSGLAPNYELLLLSRAVQGLGFGGEWAVGAVLIAEIARPEQRGRVLGMVQSAWAVGWALIVLAYVVVFSVFDESTAWRVLFALGVLPALLILYVRRHVHESEVYIQTRETGRPEQVPLATIFRPGLLGITLAGSLLATGAQGGYYALFTWLPKFLKSERDLNILGVGSYLLVIIVGAFCGYALSGYLHDWLGRRRAFAWFAVLSALTVIVYTLATSGDRRGLLLVLGFPLGFFPSGMFSGFGSYLAELYPTRSRGAGQGFCYNFGRAAGALFPFLIGILSESIGLTAAIALGAAAYGLSLVALLALPETRGRQLVVD